LDAGVNSSDSRNGLAFEVTHRMVLSIAIPMTLGFITTPLLGLVGTGVVGHMSDPDALAGLAIGAMLFDLILGSFNFLRASTTGLTAQAYGRRDRHAEQGVFWRAIISALGCGVALLCLSPLLLAAGLTLMGPENAVAQATSTYFSIRILAGPAALANYAILGFVLGRGQGSIGLLLQTIINGINIVLAIALGLWLDWGIQVSPGRRPSARRSGLSPACSSCSGASTALTGRRAARSLRGSLWRNSSRSIAIS